MRKILLIALAIILGVLVVIFLYQMSTFSPLGLSLPTVTKTKIGFKGDPIDIIIIGEKNTITQVFLKADWLIPDPTNTKTTAKIIAESIANKAYPHAPISNLYLFNRKEDLSFEFPTDTVRKRHHIRLWQTSFTKKNQPVWIGSDTYDSSLELSRRTGIPTHHIDAHINQEVDFLTGTLIKTGQIKNLTSARLTVPILLGFNGNGDWYFDNGKVPVVCICVLREHLL